MLAIQQVAEVLQRRPELPVMEVLVELHQQVEVVAAALRIQEQQELVGLAAPASAPSWSFSRAG